MAHGKRKWGCVLSLSLLAMLLLTSLPISAGASDTGTRGTDPEPEMEWKDYELEMMQYPFGVIHSYGMDLDSRDRTHIAWIEGNEGFYGWEVVPFLRWSILDNNGSIVLDGVPIYEGVCSSIVVLVDDLDNTHFIFYQWTRWGEEEHSSFLFYYEPLLVHICIGADGAIYDKGTILILDHMNIFSSESGRYDSKYIDAECDGHGNVSIFFKGEECLFHTYITSSGHFISGPEKVEVPNATASFDDIYLLKWKNGYFWGAGHCSDGRNHYFKYDGKELNKGLVELKELDMAYSSIHEMEDGFLLVKDVGGYSNNCTWSIYDNEANLIHRFEYEGYYFFIQQRGDLIHLVRTGNYGCDLPMRVYHSMIDLDGRSIKNETLCLNFSLYPPEGHSHSGAILEAPICMIGKDGNPRFSWVLYVPWGGEVMKYPRYGNEQLQTVILDIEGGLKEVVPIAPVRIRETKELISLTTDTVATTGSPLHVQAISLFGDLVKGITVASSSDVQGSTIELNRNGSLYYGDTGPISRYFFSYPYLIVYYYIVLFNDMILWGPERKVPLIDDDPPDVHFEDLPQWLGTGNKTYFRINASDGGRVDDIIVRIRFGDGPWKYLSMKDPSSGILFEERTWWKLVVIVPVYISWSSVLPLHIEAISVDHFKNSNTTGERVIEVKDIVPPRISAMKYVSIREGSCLSVSAEAYDNIGIASYEWTGSPVPSSGRYLRGTVNDPGLYHVTLRVFDMKGNSAFEMFYIEVSSAERSRSSETLIEVDGIEAPEGALPDPNSSSFSENDNSPEVPSTGTPTVDEQGEPYIEQEEENDRGTNTSTLILSGILLVLSMVLVSVWSINFLNSYRKQKDLHEQ